MMSYNTYPILLSSSASAERGPTARQGTSARTEAPPQAGYHLNVVQAKRRGLIDKEKVLKNKYKKYTKILNQLMSLNACSSGISIATGISSVATFATFIGLPVSIQLGAASLTGAIASGIISTLTKNYQQKLKKVT